MENKLIQRWRRGDFEAFVALVQPHLTSIRAFVAYHGLPAQTLWDYDDLSQDALVEAFESADTYDESRGDVRSWLYGVVRNRIRRAWQEAVRLKKRTEKAEFELRHAAVERTLNRDLDAAPVLQALHECMDKLPSNGKKIIRAHYQEGLSGHKIAHLLKMTTSAVYVALHRLRRALRLCLEERLGYGLKGSGHGQ